MKKQIKSFKLSSTKLNVALGMNVAIFAMVLLASILMFANLDPFDWNSGFHPGQPMSAGEKLKFFTVLSNLFMGIIAALMVVIISLYKTKKIKSIHRSFYIIDLISTTGVALTMFVTVFILAPFATMLGEKTFTLDVLFTGSNLLFHLLIPLFSIITFISFLNTQEIKLKETTYAYIPIVVYMIFYISMALTHIDPETGLPKLGYDWYMFFHFGYGISVLFAIAVMGLSFLIMWLLWLGNRKIHAKKVVFEFALSSIVIVMGVAATIWGFIDYKFQPPFYVWFTNLSNWLMIIGFITYIIFLSLRTAGKIKSIPQGIIIFQLIGIVAAAITLFGVLFFILPMKKPGWDAFAKYNIFFHLLLPVFGIGTFLFTEHAPQTKFRYLWISIIPAELYLIFYFVMYYINGSDWYDIVAILGKAWPVSFVAAVGFQFLIAWLLWLGNRYIHIGYPKPQPYFKKRLNH